MRLSICPDRLEGESARGRVRASVACCCACVFTILEGECLYADDGECAICNTYGYGGIPGDKYVL